MTFVSAIWLKFSAQHIGYQALAVAMVTYYRITPSNKCVPLSPSIEKRKKRKSRAESLLHIEQVNNEAK